MTDEIFEPCETCLVRSCCTMRKEDCEIWFNDVFLKWLSGREWLIQYKGKTMKTDMERKAREIRNYLENVSFEIAGESGRHPEEVFNDEDFFYNMIGDKIYDECSTNGELNSEKIKELVDELEKLAHTPMKNALEKFKLDYSEVFVK